VSEINNEFEVISEGHKIEVAALNVPLGQNKVFNFEDHFKNRQIFKSGSNIKKISKEYMSLHLNAIFLEEPWAFFVSDRKTVPATLGRVLLHTALKTLSNPHKPWIDLFFLEAWQMA